MLSKSEAQQAADRIRLLRQELASPDVKEVLDLSPEQQQRFDSWSQSRLSELAKDFDIDTTVEQKRASWGMRIASTLGAFALCAAVVLFFARFWGDLQTSTQVAIVFALPLILLVAAEYVSRRERTYYFTGLLSLVAFASFILNLSTHGSVFNVTPSERALLVWGIFALALAYRYGLRLMLTCGLLLLTAFVAAAFASQWGFRWFDFHRRPELVALLALICFAVPFAVRHVRNTDFPPIYRLTGAVVFYISLLTLSEGGSPSYLPLNPKDIERLYEFVGLLSSAGAIYLGIRRNWTGIVNTSATAFVLFLFARLFHWWWDWMPKYLFFAIIGGIGIGLVLLFKRVRSHLPNLGAAA